MGFLKNIFILSHNEPSKLWLANPTFFLKMKPRIFFLTLALMVGFLSGPLSAQNLVANVTHSDCWKCSGGVKIEGLCPNDTALYEFHINGLIIVTNENSLDSLCPGDGYVVVTSLCVCVTIPFTIGEYGIGADPILTNPRCLKKGSAEISVNGGTWPYNFQVVNTTTNQVVSTDSTASNLVAGVVYSYTVTDAHNCSTNGQFVLYDEPNDLILNLSTTQPGCGSFTGNIMTSVGNANGNVIYNWSNGSTAKSLINVGPGTYTVTVTDVDGCTKTGVATINAPVQPAISASATATTCGLNNGTVTFTANNANSIHLTGPNGFTQTTLGSTLSVDSLPAGTYTVVATNSTSGCTASTTAIVAGSLQPHNIVEYVNLCVANEVNGVWVSNDTTLNFQMQTPDGCWYLKTYKVKFLNGDTTQTLIHVCYGETVIVDGVQFKNDTVITKAVGQCGVNITTIKFGNAPTENTVTIPVCGLSTTIYSTSTTLDSNGCVAEILHTIYEPQLFDQVTITGPNEPRCGTGAPIWSGDGVFVDYPNCEVESHGHWVVFQQPKDTTIIKLVCNSWEVGVSTVVYQGAICDSTVHTMSLPATKPDPIMVTKDTCTSNPNTIPTEYVLVSNFCKPDSIISWNKIPLENVGRDSTTCDSAFNGIQLPPQIISGTNGNCDVIETVTLRWEKPQLVLVFDEEQSCVPKPPITTTVVTYSDAGCDSVITKTTTTFVVSPQIEKHLDPRTLCAGEKTFFDGKWQGPFTPGTAVTLTATYTSVDGCDSIVSVNIFTNLALQGELKVTLCSSDSIEINGDFYYGADGDMGFSYVTSSQVIACDSTIAVTINVVDGVPFLSTNNGFYGLPCDIVPALEVSSEIEKTNGEVESLPYVISRVYAVDEPCHTKYTEQVIAYYCGDTLRASRIVELLDSVAPTFISIPPDVTITDTSDIASFIGNIAGLEATDNCGIKQITDTLTKTGNYEWIQTWTATDGCFVSTGERKILLDVKPVTPPVDSVCNIDVFPNPVAKGISAKATITGINPGTVKLDLQDMVGKSYWTAVVVISGPAGITVTLPANNFSPGLYVLILESDDGSIKTAAKIIFK